MEKHPILEGESSADWWFKQALIDYDLDALKELPEIRYLLEWYPGVEEFFKTYYPEGFWWSQKVRQGN